MTDAATMEVKDTIKKLGDSIVGLTLLEAQQLSDYLKNTYGIEPAAGGAVMMAAPGGGGGAAAAEENRVQRGPQGFRGGQEDLGDQGRPRDHRPRALEAKDRRARPRP
jgi:hypothetical protein